MSWIKKVKEREEDGKLIGYTVTSKKGKEKSIPLSSHSLVKDIKEWESIDGNVIEPMFTEAEREQLDVKKKKKEKRDAREAVLKNGTTSSDGKMWFNFESASMFMTAVAVLEDGDNLPWYDANREKIMLSKDEAKAYGKEILTAMQLVYGLEDDNS